MTIEQRVAVLEEIFSKLNDYYTSAYSGEEIDARLASAGVPIGITKEYKSVAEMNQDFTGTDVQRGQFVLILPDSTASADYGKVYLKGTANWVPAFTLTTLTSIKGPIGPPGKKGDKGDPGEAGSSFVILGYFDTLDALKAAVLNPKSGDVYGVGTAPPYNIYIWDSVHGKWVGNGNLLALQKAQARKNINSAPGGFGWGEAMKDVLASEVEDTYKTYCGKLDMLLADMPDGTSQLIYTRGPVSTGQYSGAGNIVAVLSKILGTSASLIGLSPDPRGTTNGLWRMLKDNGNWQPVEWINPPMQLGVEYRTTERYLGKPVYVKTINMGNLPGNAVKMASFQSNNVVDKIVSVTGQCTTDSGVNVSMPYHTGSGPNWNTVILIGADGSGAAQIVTFAPDFSEYKNACITVKYTKLAD